MATLSSAYHKRIGDSYNRLYAVRAATLLYTDGLIPVLSGQANTPFDFGDAGGSELIHVNGGVIKSYDQGTQSFELFPLKHGAVIKMTAYVKGEFPAGEKGLNLQLNYDGLFVENAIFGNQAFENNEILRIAGGNVSVFAVKDPANKLRFLYTTQSNTGAGEAAVMILFELIQ